MTAINEVFYHPDAITDLFIIQFFEGIDALDSLNMDLFDFRG